MAIEDNLKLDNFCEGVSREQMEKELREAGWQPSDPEEGTDGVMRIYNWWYPHFKKVLAPEERSWGTHVEAAYQTMRRNRREEERESAHKEGKNPVICNKCGDDLRIIDADDENLKRLMELNPGRTKEELAYNGTYGLMTKVSGGYFSPHLHDTIIYRFNLCEKCLVELFKTFKTDPAIESYMW